MGGECEEANYQGLSAETKLKAMPTFRRIYCKELIQFSTLIKN